MSGLDFVDPERGLSVSLRPAGPAVVFDHDSVLAASPTAGSGLGDGDDVRLELGGISIEAELSAVGTPLDLEGERTGSERLTVCRVLGELAHDGDRRPLACLGVRSEEGSPPDPAASLTRSIAVAFGDGGLLALRGARPQGADEHGDEELVAAAVSPAGEVTRVREPLLSTQYDDDGKQVRATLEMWSHRDNGPVPPLRAAGTVVCGTSISLEDRRLDLAFFRWSMAGSPGLGRYEVLRAPAPA